MIYKVYARLALDNFFFRMYHASSKYRVYFETDGVEKKTWGIQEVKNPGKVNLFAGQTIEKIFIYSVNTVNKYFFRRGVMV